jgi:hypothetical protein
LYSSRKEIFNTLVSASFSAKNPPRALRHLRLAKKLSLWV